MMQFVQPMMAISLLAVVSLQTLGGATHDAIAGSSTGQSPAPQLVSSSEAGLGTSAAKVGALAADARSVLRRTAPHTNALFANDGAVWSLGRRRALLLGGQRAVLMQVADPRIAAGVLDYSNFKQDAVGRLKRTMEAMHTIQYGAPQDAQRMLDGLERMHKKIQGTTSDGQHYDAMDPDLQYWVLATLVDSALEVERRFVGSFGEAQRAEYFMDSRRLARAFNIPEQSIPSDYQAFKNYIQLKNETLRPNEQSRDIAVDLLRPSIDMVPDFATAPLGWVTRDLLPAPLAKSYDLPELGLVQHTAIKLGSAFARGITR